MQSSISKTNHRLSIASIPSTVDINNPKKGDIIQMENGSRKKFDGVVWRKICSIPHCLIAAQRDDLCRKHYIKINGKPNQESPNVAKFQSTDEKQSKTSREIFEIIKRFLVKCSEPRKKDKKSHKKAGRTYDLLIKSFRIFEYKYSKIRFSVCIESQTMQKLKDESMDYDQQDFIDDNKSTNYHTPGKYYSHIVF